MAITTRRLFVAVAATAAILLALYPRLVRAEPPRGVHVLHGTYRGSALEIRHDSGFPIEYCTILSTAEFDGRGNVSADTIRRCTIEGTIHDVNTGTYTVSRDGVVIFSYGGVDGGKGVVGINGDIVVLDNYLPSAPDPNVLIFHGTFVRM